MSDFLFLPPVAFIIFILIGLSFALSGRLIAAKGEDAPGKYKSYACGEDDVVHHVSPDYSQFFPYAFFFTIIHVLVMVVATIPKNVLGLPLLFLASGVLALVVLFRR